MEIEDGVLDGRVLTGLIGSGVTVLETSLVLVIFGYMSILVLISIPMGVVNTLWLCSDKADINATSEHPHRLVLPYHMSVILMDHLGEV